MYTGMKHLHMGLAYLSVAGFVLRGIWMMLESPWLHRKLVRILPHVIDTLLLISAGVLAVFIQQYPLVHGWLTAKLLGLVAYIVLGLFALRKGRTRAIRIACFLAALLVFAWMISVAKSKNPMGFLAGLL